MPSVAMSLLIPSIPYPLQQASTSTLALNILNTQTPDGSLPLPPPPPLAPSTRLTRLSPRSNTHHTQEARGFYPFPSPPSLSSPKQTAHTRQRKSRHPHPRPAKSSTLFSQHIYPAPSYHIASVSYLGGSSRTLAGTAQETKRGICPR